MTTFSHFKHNPGVIHFQCSLETPQNHLHNPLHTEKPKSKTKTTHAKSTISFYHGRKVHRYNCVINNLKHRGFVQTTKKSKTTLNLFWNAQETPKFISGFSPFTKFNHLPASWHLGRKDLLISHLQSFARKFRTEFSFFPTSFVLPADADALAAFASHEDKALVIYKPANASCGRGIKVLDAARDLKSLNVKKLAVVQRYLDDPMLINERKFDLRIYVLVTSLDPLKIYVYDEGLVRLATEPYTMSKKSLSNTCVHLTNYSVNKKSKLYVKNQERRSSAESTQASVAPVAEASVDDESGSESDSPAAHVNQAASKLSLTDLRNLIGIPRFEALFTSIKEIAIKTVISAESAMIGPLHRASNHASCLSHGVFPYSNCFELYGFDILVDKSLKPWLLEVNVSPSLSSSSPFDKRVKTGLIAETFNLVGLVVPETAGAPIPVPTKKNVLAFKSETGIEEFDEFDWRLVTATLDEWSRRGKWQVAYPTKVSVEKFLGMIETRRYSNEVLARWLRADDQRGLKKRLINDR
jgi:tubulin polyglutamylase TTLL4